LNCVHFIEGTDLVYLSFKKIKNTLLLFKKLSKVLHRQEIAIPVIQTFIQS